MFSRLKALSQIALIVLGFGYVNNASASAETEGRQIIEYCKSLYSDPRLDILRVRTAFNAQDLTVEHFMQDFVPSDAELAVFPLARSYGQQCRNLTMEWTRKYLPATAPAAELNVFRNELVWAALAKKQITWSNANYLRKQAWLELYQQATNDLLAEEERARQRRARASEALNNAARAAGTGNSQQSTTTWCRWVGSTFSCSQF